MHSLLFDRGNPWAANFRVIVLQSDVITRKAEESDHITASSDIKTVYASKPVSMSCCPRLCSSLYKKHERTLVLQIGCDLTTVLSTHSI